MKIEKLQQLRQHAHELTSALPGLPAVLRRGLGRLTDQRIVILGLLFRARGGLVERQALPQGQKARKLLDVQVCHIRKELAAGWTIETTWGRGYRLVGPYDDLPQEGFCPPVGPEPEPLSPGYHWSRPRMIDGVVYASGTEAAAKLNVPYSKIDILEDPQKET